MVFLKTDIGMFLSGGTNNTDINQSLGNVISNASVSTGVLNNMFPDTTPQQALSGIVRFRCVYIKNLNATQVLQSPKIWMASNSLSAFDELDLAIGSAGKGFTENPIINETTAPANVQFTHPTSEVNALELPTLSPNEYKSIWVRMTVQANASPFDNNAAIIRIRGTPL